MKTFLYPTMQQTLLLASSAGSSSTSVGMLAETSIILMVRALSIFQFFRNVNGKGGAVEQSSMTHQECPLGSCREWSRCRCASPNRRCMSKSPSRGRHPGGAECKQVSQAWACAKKKVRPSSYLLHGYQQEWKALVEVLSYRTHVRESFLLQQSQIKM